MLPLVVAGIAVMVLFVGCADPAKGPAARKVVVEVSGSKELSYTGSFGDQVSQHKIEDAVIPGRHSFQAPQGAIIVNLRKNGREGILHARLLLDGRVVKEGETRAPFGTVNLTVPLE